LLIIKHYTNRHFTLLYISSLRSLKFAQKFLMKISTNHISISYFLSRLYSNSHYCTSISHQCFAMSYTGCLCLILESLHLTVSKVLVLHTNGCLHTNGKCLWLSQSPRTATELRKQSFIVAALVIKYSLPTHVLISISKGQFWRELKAHLFQQAYNL